MAYNRFIHWKDVIKLWFFEVTREQMWEYDPKFDDYITQLWGECHKLCLKGEYIYWREEDPLGVYAEIVVFARFSRYIYRGKPEAYANDAHALELAKIAINTNCDKNVSKPYSGDFYAPFIFSESK